MSIWCTGKHIGTDPTVMYELEPGLYEVDIDGTRAEGRHPVPQVPERGNVLSYAEGFSNHYPDLTGTHERPAVVMVASVPAWCVPGHRETDDCEPIGPWLRLDVTAPETLSFWTEDADDRPKVERRDISVVMDEDAVRSLRDDLTAWLDRPKVRPA